MDKPPPKGKKRGILAEIGRAREVNKITNFVSLYRRISLFSARAGDSGMWNKGRTLGFERFFQDGRQRLFSGGGEAPQNPKNESYP
jgi:hypothetical protein